MMELVAHDIQEEVYLAPICSVAYWTNVRMMPLNLLWGRLKRQKQRTMGTNPVV